MPYAIMRFEKRKGGPASALERHHERKKEQYASNPDIDSERSHLNYHLVEPARSYYGEIQSRIEAAQRQNPRCKVRKDSVKFIDTIVTASPEYLAALPPERVKRYFERAQSPYAPLLRAADQGPSAVRQGGHRQPGKAGRVAGQVS